MKMNEWPTRAEMPRIALVSPASGTTVEVTWRAGSRTNRKEKIDLAPLLFSKKIFRPLRDDPILFSTVHVISRGNAIAWAGNDDLEMSATSIEQLAKESLTAVELQEFLQTQRLTHEAFAALIGYSRRQVENFLSGAQPVPRVVSLACIGLAQRNAPAPKLQQQMAPASVAAGNSERNFPGSIQQFLATESHMVANIGAISAFKNELEDCWVSKAGVLSGNYVVSVYPSPQHSAARALQAATNTHPSTIARHVKVG